MPRIARGDMGTSMYLRRSELTGLSKTVESHEKHMRISELNIQTEPFNLAKT